ncbi:Kelch repeat-containing proteins [Plasmopara halstedii]|uniref:Kelch repeat-containing proteins n=1 Tax=Plasmopara halstedii TaxID=4781 RepID=A0A0P1AKH7_PLAHL|nr:Kelch repeat-containing proteins [Plasmopara halstedii]CEG41761.1 Kelch repeat-containing proteins [Plasmopara halstedii]|eukprot:XP_024578130.1 Kelch repeat-containing proteins [Plasmopara halstedii]
MPLLSYEGVAVDLPANLAGIQFEFTSGSLTIRCRNFTGDIVLTKPLGKHLIGEATSAINKRTIDLSASKDDDSNVEVKRQRPNFLKQTSLLSQLKDHRSEGQDEDTIIEPDAEVEEKKTTETGSDALKLTLKPLKTKATTKKGLEEMNSLSSPGPKQSISRKSTPNSKSKRSKALKLSPDSSCNEMVIEAAKVDPKVVKWEMVEAVGSKPLERWGHTATKISDERVVVYGGTDDDERTLGDLHIFDMKTHRWTTPINCETIARTWHDAVFLSSKNLVLVFGGERSATAEGEFDILSDIMVLDTECFLWYPPAIQGSPPSARSGHTCTVIGNEVVVFGGSRGRNRQSSVHILDTDNWNWKAVKVDGKPPSARTYHSAVVIGEDRILYFGGNDSSKSFNSVHVLQKVDVKPSGSSWTWVHPCVTGVPPQERTGHSATLLNNGEILIFGGWDPQRDDANASTNVFDDAFLLNTITWEWQPTTFNNDKNADTLMRGRVGHGAVLDCNGRLHLFGGQNGVEQRLKDICALTVSDAVQSELKC